MIMLPGISESNCIFNACREESVFLCKKRLFCMQVIHGRYDHFENKLKIQVANYERYASHIFVVKL